jgi:hypothetical protein
VRRFKKTSNCLVFEKSQCKFLIKKTCKKNIFDTENRFEKWPMKHQQPIREHPRKLTNTDNYEEDFHRVFSVETPVKVRVRIPTEQLKKFKPFP